ncbi:MAG: LysR substrate-binding domain-containing protein, partial [Pseudomonadota bacterium]
METIRYLDAQLDLVAEGIDLALRMGDMTSSTLRSRRLGSIGRKLVCAPSYLNSLPRIKKPEDLSHAEFVAMQGLTDQLTMVNGR